MTINIRLTRPENVAYFGAVHGAMVSIDLEEYLGGVVPSEAYESRTPDEALKAQAIAARSFAASRARDGVTMDDTGDHQAYRAHLGTLETSPRCLRAVRDTAGQVLRYGGSTIEANYSRSNGGMTRRSEQVWKESRPYYQNRPDPWDAAARAEAALQGIRIRESHGVGLSQVGAEYAARSGYSCEDILAFYYPGTTIGLYENGDESMAKPLASRVCATSIACARKKPPIKYRWGFESATQQDCQGHIEFCVRENGGTMRYAGSNDMFRNACDWVGKIEEAKARGYFIPGALLFQVKPGGDYPAKYHADGKGNAQHIGYLTAGLQGVELVHASSSAGVVKMDTMNSAWNYLGLAKAIDYSEYLGGAQEDTPSDQPSAEGEMTGVVTADGKGLNMRATPGGAYMLKIPPKAQVVIAETAVHGGELWGKTQWPNEAGRVFTGWVMMRFVRLHREEDTAAKTLAVVIPVADEDAAGELLGLYSGAYIMEVNG